MGPLVLATTLAAIEMTTFGAGMPLWLIQHGDVAKDSPLIGWTLAVFDVAAVGASVASGWAAARIAPARILAAAMLGAPIALGLTLMAVPGSLAFFGSTFLAGALASVAFPLLIVAAQDRSPQAAGAASGMLMGLPTGWPGSPSLGSAHWEMPRAPDRPTGRVRQHGSGGAHRQPGGRVVLGDGRRPRIADTAGTKVRLPAARVSLAS